MEIILAFMLSSAEYEKLIANESVGTESPKYSTYSRLNSI
jgi:hypothetical protein